MSSFLFQLCQHHDVLLFFSGVDVGHATFKVNLESTELEAKTELLWELTNNVKPCRASRLRDFVFYCGMSKLPRWGGVTTS